MLMAFASSDVPPALLCVSFQRETWCLRALETCHVTLGEPKSEENGGFVGYVFNLALEKLKVT